MNSPVARSYPKRGQRAAPSYTSVRRQRRSAGVPSRHPIVDQSGAAAQKWTRVLRNPTSPLDEPYFGSGPSAAFKIPVWVRVSDLTEEEKIKYDEVEKKKEEDRLAWKKILEERRASEPDTTDDKGEETKDEGSDDDPVNDSDDEKEDKEDDVADNEQSDVESNVQQTEKEVIVEQPDAKSREVDEHIAADPEEFVEAKSATAQMTGESTEIALDTPCESSVEVGTTNVEVTDPMQSESAVGEISQSANERKDLLEGIDQSELWSEPLPKKQRLAEEEESH